MSMQASLSYSTRSKPSDSDSVDEKADSTSTNRPPTTTTKSSSESSSFFLSPADYRPFRRITAAEIYPLTKRLYGRSFADWTDSEKCEVVLNYHSCLELDCKGGTLLERLSAGYFQSQVWCWLEADESVGRALNPLDEGETKEKPPFKPASNGDQLYFLSSKFVGRQYSEWNAEEKKEVIDFYSNRPSLDLVGCETAAIAAANHFVFQIDKWLENDPQAVEAFDPYYLFIDRWAPGAAGLTVPANWVAELNHCDRNLRDLHNERFPAAHPNGCAGVGALPQVGGGGNAPTSRIQFLFDNNTRLVFTTDADRSLATGILGNRYPGMTALRFTIQQQIQQIQMSEGRK